MDVPRAILTVAGTDPSGGAGLQVDLQVFRDFGFHGLSVVTAVVWQNTVGVHGFEPVSAERVRLQLDAVLEDVPVAAIKLGMLATPPIVEVVADVLEGCSEGVPIVFDPVLSGGSDAESLGRSGLVDRICASLLDEVTVVTPNVPEAERLLGRSIGSRGDMEEAAEELLRRSGGAALVKGGHAPGAEAGESVRDVLAVDGAAEWLEPLPRVDRDVRGTGCQLASAIAARLVRGDATDEAVETARAYLNRSLRDRSVAIGDGRPVVVRTESGRNRGDDT